MTVEINSSRTVAVDREYYWQPIDTCPRGVKVQLLGAGGVAVYGQYYGKDKWWTHWAPLPVKPKADYVACYSKAIVDMVKPKENT